MKVTFLRHSCFLVELEQHSLLFDWYEGDLPVTDKPLYVFASHSHDDHFSPEVFRCPGIAGCFLSDDISRDVLPPELAGRTVFVSPHQTCELDGLKIATLKSTDMGVAYLIECEGKLLYHAGDLNCWAWPSVPKLHRDLAAVTYRREVGQLKGKSIDAAFVPLDPRLGTAYDLGMKLFMEAADARVVFPMHMWDDYSVVPRLKADSECRSWSGKVADISGPGQEFDPV